MNWTTNEKKNNNVMKIGKVIREILTKYENSVHSPNAFFTE